MLIRDKISFTSRPRRNGKADVFIQSVEGGGEPDVLVGTPNNEFGTDWSSDGKYLAYGKGQDIWYLRRKEDESGYEAVPFIQSAFDENSANFSPDGRFLAYVSDKSGRYEVYVQRFPDGGGRVTVSTNGGVQPRWRGDSKELFYVEDDTLVAVSVTTSPSFSVGAVTRLFEDRGALARARGHHYDVAPDGRRFVLVETLEQPAPAIRVVENWFAEFRDREQD